MSPHFLGNKMAAKALALSKKFPPWEAGHCISREVPPTHLFHLKKEADVRAEKYFSSTFSVRERKPFPEPPISVPFSPHWPELITCSLQHQGLGHLPKVHGK